MTLPGFQTVNLVHITTTPTIITRVGNQIRNNSKFLLIIRIKVVKRGLFTDFDFEVEKKRILNTNKSLVQRKESLFQ